jgi:hypothetical protein
VALTSISAFCILPSAFALSGFGWLCRFRRPSMLDVGCSMLDVRCWMFDVGCSLSRIRPPVPAPGASITPPPSSRSSGFEVALGEPWGGFRVAIGCLSTRFDVALRWLRVALRSSLSGFSFQLSAFQLLPECGFGVALMSHWVALPGFSRFEVQGSGFKVRVPSDTRAFHSFAACSLGVH